MKKFIAHVKHQFVTGVLGATTTWRKVYRWTALAVTAALFAFLTGLAVSIGTSSPAIILVAFLALFMPMVAYMCIDTYADTERYDAQRVLDEKRRAYQDARVAEALEELSQHLSRMDGLLARASKIADPLAVAAARATADQLEAAVNDKKRELAKRSV